MNPAPPPSSPLYTYPLGRALEFLERLWALNHALERRSAYMARHLGLTARQRLVVRCLGRYPGLSAGHLADLLHVDPGTLSAALRRLEAAGLVERRADPRDGRRAALGLTEAGRRYDRPTSGTVEEAVERVLAESSAQELAAAARVFERLTSQLLDGLDAG